MQTCQVHSGEPAGTSWAYSLVGGIAAHYSSYQNSSQVYGLGHGSQGLGITHQVPLEEKRARADIKRRAVQAEGAKEKGAEAPTCLVTWYLKEYPVTLTTGSRPL